MTDIDSIMSPSVLQTSLLSSVRFVLFFACRKYIQSLYHQLQDIAAENEVQLRNKSTTTGSDTPVESIELDGRLPSPTVAVGVKLGVTARLLGRRDLHFDLARTCFSLCFGESCLLFLLLICQSASLLDASTRTLNWKISLYILLVVNVVVVPLCFAFAVTHRTTRSPTEPSHQRPFLPRMILTLFPVACYLFLLSCVPVPSAAEAGWDFTAALLSRLTVVGVVLLGSLSGLGCTASAWAYWPIAKRTRRGDVSQVDVDASERSLLRVQDDLSMRRTELAKLEASQAPADSSWFSRIVPVIRGESAHTSALQEIKGLELLEYQMVQELQAMRREVAQAKFASTWIGRLLNWGGHAFALYCLFRVFNALVNVLLLPFRPSGHQTGSTSSDMIATVLASLIACVPSVHISEKQLVALARQISLGAIGIILISSLRMVLKGVTRILRVSNRKLGASLMLLVLAELMVTYLLSTLIQLRNSFPPPTLAEPGQSDTNLFATLPEFQVFGALFDWTLVLGAMGSAGVRWFYAKIRG